MSEVLRWDACWNVRDLGGYATSDGGATRTGAVVRAGNLSRLTDAGRDALLRHGVRSVIDLRDAGELEIDVEPFRDGARWAGQVRYANLPLISEAEWVAIRDPGRRAGGYLLTLQLSRPNVGAILRAIARAPAGGVAVHCHAGKERTGVIAALLLLIAGVPSATIADDYVESDRHLASLYEEWAARESDPEKRTRLLEGFRCRAEDMAGPLRWIEAQGGTAAYLATCGLARSDVEAIRARLTRRSR